MTYADQGSLILEPQTRDDGSLPYMHLKAYAGIGSRETPAAVAAFMRRLGARLGGMNFTLRSGGATGADEAFDAGAESVGGLREIFLPWRTFSPTTAPLLLDNMPGRDRAYALAAQYHRGWADLEESERALMARNVLQVLGRDCKQPAGFVICFAEKSKVDREGRIYDVDGGTGQAVRVAYGHGIPVFNLAQQAHMDRLTAFYNRPRADKQGVAA